MGYFTIFQSEKDKQFYYNLKADNHEIILASEGYTAKENALNGIHAVQKNAAFEERYDRRISKDNQDYFVLKAANGEIIGTSELYKSKAAMENGIVSVMKNGSSSPIKE